MNRRWRDLPHDVAMRSHALRRLFQRHGIAITDAEYAAINGEIASGANPVLAPGRGNRTLHAVQVRDRTVYVVWDVELSCIATFLPGVPMEVLYPNIAKAIA